MNDARADWVVDAEGLGKSFGRAVALRSIELRVRQGESIAIFGPNGAGKTTLLRLCATLYRPSRGILRLFGSDDRGPAVRRRIGFLGHQSLLYPDLSVRENLLFYARLYGVADAGRTVDGWIARFALDDCGLVPLRSLSRGMEQRVALARTLLHEPDLMLLDEPWTGLDAQASDHLQGLLAGLRREGRTLVVATHDFARGLALGDRAIIIHRGQVAWETAIAGDTSETLDDVYRRVTGALAA